MVKGYSRRLTVKARIRDPNNGKVSIKSGYCIANIKLQNVSEYRVKHNLIWAIHFRQTAHNFIDCHRGGLSRQRIKINS